MALRSSSIILCISLLFFSPLLMADDLESAQAYEKEGQFAQARQFYIKWLENRGNAGDPSYGRILIHALRIAGTVDEDLELISRFHSNLQSSDDKLDIYETAVVLTELVSDHDRNSEYLNLLNSLQINFFSSSYPALERLLIQNQVLDNSSGSSFSLETLPWRLRKLFFLMFISSVEDPDRLSKEIEDIQKAGPTLLNEPEWLYIVQFKLDAAGLNEQAEEYRKRLMNQFPLSIEAAMLTREKIQRYPEAGDFFRNPDLFETVSPDAGDNETEAIFIQAGAFQNPENARTFKENLERYGLECRMVAEGTVYKVIVLTGDYNEVVRLLDSLGIKGFRIPRIP